MKKSNSNSRKDGKKLVVSFYKKRTCWYAEVPQHTEAQNMMVSGADDMCEVLSEGHKRLTLTVVGYDVGEAPKGALIVLDKVAQSNYGATYDMVAKKQLQRELPPQCWLCNVTRTVFGGNHPEHIAIVDSIPNDRMPYTE